MPSLTQQLLLVLDPPKREGRFLLPGNDRRPADISVPHWSNGKDAARRGEAKGGGGEEAGGRREAAYQDVREGRERYDRRSQDRLDTVGEREEERLCAIKPKFAHTLCAIKLKFAHTLCANKHFLFSFFWEMFPYFSLILMSFIRKPCPARLDARPSLTHGAGVKKCP